MNSYDLFNPIVVAKPVRGREMRTTVIPKETMNAMKVVSTKTFENDSSIIENSKTGDYPEIYHEGYINGKLFMVPDSNLLAMRDIVNKKMKRRPSGKKPQQFIDKTSNYDEFVTKFDNLLEKIDQFADSSSDDLNTSDNKNVCQKQKKSLKMENNMIEKYELFGLQKVKPVNMMYATSKKESSENKNKFESVTTDEMKNETEFDNFGDIKPPLLDETIKYKRVKQNSSILNTKNTYNKNIPQTGEFPDCDWNHPIKDPDSETFRFLISGHFKNNSSPTFIIHQNYIGPNVLENYIPDFKSHKQEGNVHIFITGKFFTSDILVDETISSSAALSIPPYIIPINSDNTIWNEQFKGVYGLGSVDIAIKGEFVQDKDTLQFTPIISLDIIKPEPITNSSEVINLPTAVLYSKQTQKSSFEDSDDKDKAIKHVHYAKSDDTEFKGDQCNEQEKQKFTWKNMKKVVKNIAIYNLFSKNTNNLDYDISPSDNVQVSSSHEDKSVHSNEKMKRRSVLKQHFRGKKGQRRRSRILEEIREDKLIETKFASLPERKGSLERKSSTKKDSLTINDSNIKKKKKVKKGDKNQAIIENPILAQMQEFFLV